MADDDDATTCNFQTLGDPESVSFRLLCMLLLDRTVCIVTYGGDAFHSALNTTLLVVSMAGAWRLTTLALTTTTRWNDHLRQQQQEQQRLQPLEESNSLLQGSNDNSVQQEHLAAAAAAPWTPPSVPSTLASLGFVIVFQVGLCLMVHCSGISIVWCAIAGWMLVGTGQLVLCWDRQQQQQQQQRRRHPFGTSHLALVALSLLCDAAGVLYYAATAPAITTVAHLCAIAMGMILYLLCSSTAGCHLQNAFSNSRHAQNTVNNNDDTTVASHTTVCDLNLPSNKATKTI